MDWLARLRDGDDGAVTWLRRAAVGVLVVGLLACAGEGGNGPADPALCPPGVTLPAPAASTTPVTDAVPPPDPGDVPSSAMPPAEACRVPLAGFGEVAVEVRAAGEAKLWCLLLAETDAQRQRGLMAVTDAGLGGYDGMLFRYDEPVQVGFWNRNVPQPLSIAYLGDDGRIVSVEEMAPCADTADCPSYPPAGPFRWAVEVPVAAGGVTALGLAGDALLVDIGATCPV